MTEAIRCLYVSHSLSEFGEMVQGYLWPDNALCKVDYVNCFTKERDADAVIDKLPEGSYQSFKDNGILRLGVAFPTERARQVITLYSKWPGSYASLYNELMAIKNLLSAATHYWIKYVPGGYSDGEDPLVNTKSLHKRERFLIQQLHKLFP